jgi:hypothetical protein
MSEIESRTATRTPRMLPLLSLTVAVLAAGCAQVGIGGNKSESTAAAPAPAPAAAPAAPKSKAGMNDRGEVVDSSKVEAGSGVTVKGVGGWEGEITGKPGPGSKFTKLQIGMSMRETVDLAGQPTDQGGYITGNAWIPFYFGADRHRYEMVFKGQGRLIFAGGSLGNFSGGNLIWIIHNPNERGYR